MSATTAPATAQSAGPVFLSTWEWGIEANARAAQVFAAGGSLLDAVEKGRPEVLTDDWTRQVKDSVATDQDSLYPDIQRSWDAGESPWKG